MAKLADLRANLSIEEREEYEKYKNTKIKDDDDIKIMDEKNQSGAGSSTSRNGMQGCFFFKLSNWSTFVQTSLKLSKLSDIGQTLL